MTHFDGITSDGNCGFNLIGDAILLDENKQIAFFANVNFDDEAC